MSFHQSFGYGETETAATGSSGTGFIHAVKAFKDVGQVLGRNTFTCIYNAYLYPVALLCGNYGDGISFSRVS